MFLLPFVYFCSLFYFLIFILFGGGIYLFKGLELNGWRGREDLEGAEGEL